MTRIAILLSGHIRSFKYAKENIQRLRNTFPLADIFIHTWKTSEIVTQTHQKPQYERLEVNPEFIESLYPAKYFIENQDETSIDAKYIKSLKSLPQEMWPAVFGYYWMIYGILKCTELMRKEELDCGYTYEIVLRYRFDLIVNALESLKQDLLFIESNTSNIILSTNKNWWPFGVYSDVMWITRASNHKVFIKRVFESMSIDITEFKNSKIFLPEMIITKTFRKNGFKITPASSIYRLKRPTDEHYISRYQFSLRSKFRDLRCCWTYLDINLKKEKLWVTCRNDLLRIEWKNNVEFPFKLLNISRFVFFIESFFSLIWNQVCRKLYLKYSRLISMLN